jgi:hypothetical protein
MSIGLFLLLKNKFAGFFSGIGKSLNDEKGSIGKAFGGIREGAEQTRSGVGSAFSGLGANIRNSLGVAAESASKAFSPIIGRAEDVAEKTRGAFGAMRDGMRIGPELDTVKTGFQNLGTSIGQTARGMGDTLKGVGQDIVKSVIPAGIRDAASRVHNDLAPAREAFRNLVPAAADAGREAGAALGGGLKKAGAGLLDALGGGWGIALGGATVALGAFAAAQAEAEAKISSLAGALDQQTGAFTSAAKKILAADVLDQGATWFDDLMRSGRRNMEELVAATGLNMEMVIDKLSDPKGRDAYVQNMKNVRDAAGDGKDVSIELAAAVGMSKEQLEGLSQTDLDEMVRQIENGAKTAEEAEQRILALAKATGTNTVEAAALSANYETLSSKTSSVSDKFRAFKQNLDITTGGLSELKNSGRDFAESMFAMEDSVVALADKNKGLVEGTKTLSEAFRSTLFNADGTFSSANRGAIEFSKSMESARDGVLKAGIAEFQKLRDAGLELPEAQAKALAAMEPQLQSMRDGLGRLGFDTAQVNQIMGQLGLDPDKLRGALSLDTADAEGKAERLRIKLAALTSGNYSVALGASTEEVKTELLKVEAYQKAYNEGGWEAVVDIIDKAGPKTSDLLLKLNEAKNIEDIKKIIDVEAKGLPKIKEMKEETKTLNEYQVGPKNFEAIDGITPVSLTALEQLRNVTREPLPPAALRAVDETGVPVAAAKANVTSLPGVTASLTATDSTAPGLESAKITMGSLPDVLRNLSSSDKTADGKNAAQATMNSLGNVTRDLMANNAANAGVSLANLTMGLFKDKTVDLKANDSASGVISTVNSKTLADKTFNIIGVLSGVSAVVRAALGMANGGIMKAGVQKFANGGILNTIKTPQVKAYAGGGVENHVAQIAKGAWPVRIWAEPETGGEAYLPLAPSKRKRSLEILRQVMQEFGLGHLAQFADGGMMNATNMAPRSGFSGFKGGASSTVVTSGSSVASPTIVTHVYPSQGLSESQVADSVSENIYWRLSSSL